MLSNCFLRPGYKLIPIFFTMVSTGSKLGQAPYIASYKPRSFSIESAYFWKNVDSMWSNRGLNVE